LTKVLGVVYLKEERKRERLDKVFRGSIIKKERGKERGIKDKAREGVKEETRPLGEGT